MLQPLYPRGRNYVSPTASLDVPVLVTTVKSMYKVVNRFQNIVKESRHSFFPQ
jgi:hypothetical protein